MSALDVEVRIEREPDPKGDRVRISMTGKFLPYKHFGAKQGLPEVGCREEQRGIA